MQLELVVAVRQDGVDDLADEASLLSPLPAHAVVLPVNSFTAGHPPAIPHKTAVQPAHLEAARGHLKPSATGPHAPARDGSQPQLAVAPAPPTHISHGGRADGAVLALAVALAGCSPPLMAAIQGSAAAQLPSRW